MANAWAANLFTIDTSVNVAGLTALKGSAPALTDDIVVKSGTLTIEAALSCKGIGIGYASINGGGATTAAKLIVADGATFIFANGATKMMLSSQSTMTVNGTMFTNGTSNGAADQTFTQKHASNWGVKVAGEWWTYVPSLTGLRCAVASTSNTTNCTTLSDPRLAGVMVGSSIEIRTIATGALLATKTVTSISSGVIGWSTGNVSVDTSTGIFIPIAGSDKVYTISGGNIVFGDGTASAWNNNGGAIPPNGNLVQQPSVSFTSDATAGSEWRLLGNIAFTGANFQYMRYAASTSMMYSLYSDAVFTDCSSHQAVGYGFSSYQLGFAITYTRCLAFMCGTSGFYIGSAFGATMTGCRTWANISYGVSVSTVKDLLIDDLITRQNSSLGLGATACYNVTVKNSQFVTNGGSGAVLNQNFGLTLALGCIATANIGHGIQMSYNENAIAANCTSFNNLTGNGLMLSYNKQIRSYGNRVYGNSNRGYVYSHCGNTDAMDAMRVAAAGDNGSVDYAWGELPAQGTSMTVGGGALQLVTQNEWVYGAPSHVAGLASWGTFAVTVTLNGATLEFQYRQSHDFGATWGEWTTIAANGTFAEPPNVEGEYLQYRVRKTDADAGIPSINVTNMGAQFTTGWTYPVSRLIRKSAMAGGLAE